EHDLLGDVREVLLERWQLTLQRLARLLHRATTPAGAEVGDVRQGARAALRRPNLGLEVALHVVGDARSETPKVPGLASLSLQVVLDVLSALLHHSRYIGAQPGVDTRQVRDRSPNLRSVNADAGHQDSDCPLAFSACSANPCAPAFGFTVTLPDARFAPSARRGLAGIAISRTCPSVVRIL